MSEEDIAARAIAVSRGSEVEPYRERLFAGHRVQIRCGGRCRDLADARDHERGFLRAEPAESAFARLHAIAPHERVGLGSERNDETNHAAKSGARPRFSAPREKISTFRASIASADRR